jgi:hypothetical protein
MWILENSFKCFRHRYFIVITGDLVQIGIIKIKIQGLEENEKKRKETEIKKIVFFCINISTDLIIYV